jgi:lysophospholipid acyltransferase (LPLAT)-like uncharacterized protein
MGLRHSLASLEMGPVTFVVDMRLRRRIEKSNWLNHGVEALVAGWVRLAYRTSKWDRVGFEIMEEALQNGESAIIVVWHQRLMMAPYLFDPSIGPICAITTSSKAGMLAGQVVKRFGLGTIAMPPHKNQISLTREVLRLMRQGVSIGMAPDGPLGPARITSGVPLAWARAAKLRVFLVSFSARRVHALSTWDRMWLPSLWTQGVFHCREWSEQISRFSDEVETERLQLSLQAALDAVTDESDRATGRLY